MYPVQTNTYRFMALILKIHTLMDEFMTGLLTANGNRITINSEVLLETPQYDNNIPNREYAPYHIAEIKYEDGKVNVYRETNGEFVNFSRFDPTEKKNLIKAAVFSAENEIRTKSFPITSVTRGDVESAGFDASGAADELMETLAGKMADAYISNGFHVDLPIIAEQLGFPKTNDTKES